jgi:ADP-ribosylglycohydrolase
MAALTLTRMLIAIAEGLSVREAIETHGNGYLGRKKLEKLAQKEDRFIIGQHFSPACYLPESFSAALALAWKYADDFSGGILANARCGGDNCHRGVVVGSLLGAGNPIPEKWIEGLVSAPLIREISSVGN